MCLKYLGDILDEVIIWCHNVITPITYGALYNWYAATDPRLICSAGWHIPTRTEFQTLAYFLDPDATANNNDIAKYLKETGFIYWDTPNTGAINTAEFNARGGGRRLDTNGTFSQLNQVGYIWGSDTAIFPATYAEAITMWYNNEIMFLTIVPNGYAIAKKQGASIRPLKDSTILTHGQTSTYTGNDGKVYRTICIGTQESVADNLAETKYRNGDLIPIVTDNATWAGLVTGAMCYYNNNINYM